MNRTPHELARLTLACLDLTRLNDSDDEARRSVVRQRT